MKKLLLGCLCGLCGLGQLRAGTETPAPALVQPESGDPFAAGTKEFQALSGAFFFFDTTQNNRPAIDYAIESLRLGFMTYNPQGPGILRGNFELVGEIFAGGIFNGPGDVLAGGSLLFRYNFIQPKARVVPYMQIGGGGVYTNIPEGESRGLISLPVEFNIQGALGLRLMMSDRWSFVLEGEYRHISNAEIKKPNFGIDSGGGNVGVGFSF